MGLDYGDAWSVRDPHIMSLSTAASLSRALRVSLDEFWKGLDQDG